MELKQAKGIVITPEGDIHSFGKHKYGNIDELTDENYHDPAFSQEIASTDWFQQFLQLTNYNYKKDTIYRESMTLAGLGLVFLFNGCSLNVRDEEYNSYFIQSPEILSEQQKNIFQENYTYLQGLIESDNAYFEGTAFTSEGDYAWTDFVYSIDEFYDKMDIPKTKERAK